MQKEEYARVSIFPIHGAEAVPAVRVTAMFKPPRGGEYAEFIGPGAEERAIEYASWKYDHLHRSDDMKANAA